MRILVGSTNAWHDSNAIGNTLSNWFSNQSDMEFANLYSRSAMPDNDVCKKYFRITETQMLKNIFSPEKIGQAFEYSRTENIENATASMQNEKRLINFIKKNNLKPIYMLSEALWSNGSWINNKLCDFIKEFAPEIFFSFATEPIILRKRMELVKKLTNAKTVLFIADDVYSVFTNSKKTQLAEDFTWCIKNADLLYGASEEICNEYGKIFNKNFHLLYKGCTVLPVEKKNNDKIELVYAGNLFYGRDKTLISLVNAIKKINDGSCKKMHLKIFTSSPVDEETGKTLNTAGVSQIVGVRPYNEVVNEMHKSDIVLHVESFDPEEIKKVRLSYSTKIADCLQSGSCTFAIGPEGIASINYLKKVDGAIVVTEVSELSKKLSQISENSDILYDFSIRTNTFAKKYHDINNVRNKINDDFTKLSEV